MQKWLHKINQNLSLRLNLMVVCEIALLLLAALLVMFYFSRKALKDEAMHHAEKTLEGTVQHIDNILLSIEQSAGNVYWELLAHLNEPERMYAYSRKVVEGNPYIVGCAIVFKPNYYPGHEFFMAYVHRKGKSVMTDDSSELEIKESYTNRPYTQQMWYTQPMETGHACWTDPLKNEDAEDEPLSTFCLPIYDRNFECVGVLAVDLSIGLLSQIVLAAKPSPNGYSTLLARNGSFIVHPDPEKLSRQTVFVQMEHGADHSVQEAAEAMVAGQEGYKRFIMDGKVWYVFYKPFQRAEVPGRAMERLGWSAGVVYPEDDIFGEYNQLIYLVLAISIIGLVLFFILCRMVINRQLSPLHMLTLSAQHLADGNYDETIPNTQRDDEIGQLQENFQHIQQSLVSYVGEQKLLTKTLKERGKVLQKAYDHAQKAERVKTAFLHHMTNQMIEPAEIIEKSVTTLCNDYQDIKMEEANREVNTIVEQTKNIINLVNHLLHVAENGSGKEESHE